MIHIAKSIVYWSGIDAEIADYVKHCTICAKYKASQAVQPMLPSGIPGGPWQELAADYFTLLTKTTSLLQTPIVSTHSFLEFIPRPPTVSSNAYKTFFLQHRTPQCFFSDNGPPFFSEHFSKFLSSHSTDHITSSPLYPKSNGFIK